MFVIFAAAHLLVQETAGLAIEVRLRRNGPMAEEPPEGLAAVPQLVIMMTGDGGV
jgi:hypothetical protein